MACGRSFGTSRRRARTERSDVSNQPAVILLSGGLDSATALAIAKHGGFEPYALSFRYGQRHAVELRPRRSGSQPHRRAAARRRRHRPAGVRRIGADRGHRRAAPRQRRRPRHAASRSPTCRPATRSSCRSHWPGPRRSAATDIFIGVNALDYSGYPDCRPEYIAAYEAMANLATKAGVEGRQRLQIHTPLIDLTKAQTIAARPRAGRRLLADAQLLRPRRRRAGLRHVRLVPAPRSRVRRARPDRPSAGTGGRPMSYRVKEIFYTLQGEGATPGGPRCSAGSPAATCGPGVSGPRTGRLPVLRHRLRRHRRPRRRPFRDGGRPGRRRRATPGRASRTPRAEPYVVCTGGEPLLQLDAAAVEALHARGFEVAVETNGTRPAPPGLDWICVSPKAGAELRPDRRRRVEAGVPASRRIARAVRAPGVRPFPAAADGRPGPRQEHPARRRVLPGAPAMAAEPADPQVPRDSRDGDLPGVHLRSRPPAAARPGWPQVRPPARPLLPGRGPRRGDVDPSPAWSWTSPTSRRPSSRCSTNSITTTSTRSTGLENPTSENLARWIWKNLQGALPLHRDRGSRDLHVRRASTAESSRDARRTCRTDADHRGIAIDEVGISGLRYPIAVWDRDRASRRPSPRSPCPSVCRRRQGHAPEPLRRGAARARRTN